MLRRNNQDQNTSGNGGARHEIMLVTTILSKPELMTAVHVGIHDMNHPLARKILAHKIKNPNLDEQSLSISYKYSENEMNMIRQWCMAGSSVHDAVSMHSLCNRIKENTSKSLAVRALQDACTAIKNGTDINTAVGMVRDVLSKGSATGYKSMGDIMKTTVAEIEYAREHGIDHLYVKTGFEEFDTRYLGLERSTVTIIAGRTSMGKTAFSMQMAEQISSRMPVAIHSLEMTSQSLAYRMLSRYTGKDTRNIKTGNIAMDSRFHKSVEYLSNLQLFIDDQSTQSLDYIVASAYKLHQQCNLGLLVVDYIGIMEKSKDSDSTAEKLGVITKGLNKLAKDLNIPIVILSQLNRSLESRVDKHPMSADLKGSGDLEQDVHMIILLYRAWIYNKEESECDAELIISKARSGPPSTIKMNFDGATTTFSSDYVKAFD